VISIKYKKKLTQIGNSSGLIINKIIKNSLGLKKGDMIEFTIKKIKGCGK